MSFKRRFEIIDYDKSLITFNKTDRIFFDDKITITSLSLPNGVKSQSTHFKIRSIDSSGNKIIYPNYYTVSVYKRKKYKKLDISTFKYIGVNNAQEYTSHVIKFTGIIKNKLEPFYTIENISPSILIKTTKKIKDLQEIPIVLSYVDKTSTHSFDVYVTSEYGKQFVKRVYIKIYKTDVIPEDFELYPPKHDKVIPSQYYSSTTTITGINTPVYWEVNNGEASIDGGLTYSSSGFIENNKTIIVRTVSEPFNKIVKLNVAGKKSEMILIPFENYYPLKEKFKYIAPVEAKQNTHHSFTFYGVTDMNNSQEYIRYSITDITGNTIIFDQISDIYPNTPVHCYYIPTTIDSENIVTITATDIATNVSVEVGKIKTINKADDKVFNSNKLYPLYHVDCNPYKEYISTTILTGINDNSSFTVTDGLLSTNGKDYYNTGTVNNNQTIFVKSIAPSSGVLTTTVKIENLLLTTILVVNPPTNTTN